MIFGKTKMELKVGIFVFVGLVILATFVLLIGDFKTWTSGYPIKFKFNFVNGVKVGAPVRFAGVNVGEVKALNFIVLPDQAKTEVEVVGWVRQEVKVPVDSIVWVDTLGLLGEKYIEIMPGKDYKKFVLAGETIVGDDPIPMHEITELAKSITQHLDETVVQIKEGQGTFGKLLTNDAIYNDLEALVSDIRKHPWKLLWKPKDAK